MADGNETAEARPREWVESSPADPVLVRRARIDRWAKAAQRLGYALYAAAMAVFFVGLANGFGSLTTALVIVLLIGGSVVLAPAILTGYAVKAAVRHDREHGHLDI